MKVSKQVVCKNCKLLYKDKSQCPLCNSTQSTNVWRGIIYVADSSKSNVAKRLGLHDNGIYALKVK